jgi:hypothetical protein
MGLTDREISALRPSLKRYSKRVERGLYLDVTPGGTMSWIFKYRFNGKQDKLVIGRYPDLTLKKAREARAKHAADVAEGKSPAGEKRKLREASVAGAEVLTVKAFGQRYYDEQVAKNWKDPSGELRYLEKDLYHCVFEERRQSREGRRPSQSCEHSHYATLRSPARRDEPGRGGEDPDLRVGKAKMEIDKDNHCEASRERVSGHCGEIFKGRIMRVAYNGV